MIKFVDEVTGTSVKIEVIGCPYQYQVRIGKTGTWKVARGRTAGQIKTGEKWGHSQYYGNLSAALRETIKQISIDEGINEEAISLAGADKWEVLVEQENRRIALIEGVEKQFGDLVRNHGKYLAGVTKEMANGKPVDEEEEDDEEADEGDED